LKTSGITNDDLIKALPELVSPHRVVRSGYSDSSLAKILAEPDRATEIGKRDYAMMMLSSSTGLRRGDVIGLKYENIDWHSNEIRLVQSKTGVATTIPLPATTGNAIADYLLNARPQSDEPYVFLTTIAPYRRLKSGCGITNRYVNMANISAEVPKRSGFHSFRRAYGKQLLEAETNLDMLLELLGQTHMDSAKPYLSIDEKGLKRCALGLVHTSEGGDVT
jgi:integrase